MKAGWQTSTLGDVLAVIRNGVNCKQDKSGKGDRISRIESISSATFDLDKVGYAKLSERDKGKNLLQRGDILFSHINSAVHVGKTAVFDCDEQVYHGVNLLLMRPKENVTSAYLNHALKYLFQTGYWRGVCKQSVNQASVNQQDISRVEIRFPRSLTEQKRIVAKLDEAFVGLAKAKENAEKNLQNAHALFESHLQSVFSQRSPGWVEKPLGELCDPSRVITYGVIKLGDETPDGVPCLRTSNVRWLYIDTKGIKRITPKLSTEYARTILKGGEVLVNVRGTLGGVAVASPEMAGWNVSREVAVVPINSSRVNPSFLSYLIGSGTSQHWLGGVKKGAAYVGINIEDLRLLPVNAPKMEKQMEVVGHLNSLQDMTQRLTRLCEQKLEALESLKKTILHEAFSGNL